LKFAFLPPKVRPVPNQPVWKSYHVVTLVVAVATCLFTASLVGQLLSRFVWAFEPKSPDEQFVLQIAGTFFGLQIGGLVCFHYFLKWHGVGWREGFGLGKPIRMALLGFVACIAFLPVAWGLQNLMLWALPTMSKLLVDWGILKEAIKPELQSTVLAIQEKANPRLAERRPRNPGGRLGAGDRRTDVSRDSLPVDPGPGTAASGSVGIRAFVWLDPFQSVGPGTVDAVRRPARVALPTVGQSGASHFYPRFLQSHQPPRHCLPGAAGPVA
jgi:hypothetical protein